MKITPFYGRQHELRELSYLCEKKTASIVALTGRRRIGKSRLIEEFASMHPEYSFNVISGLPVTKKTTAQLQRTHFAKQMEDELNIPPVKDEDWMDLFNHLASATSSGKRILFLDEISWMGSLDPHFLSKLKNAWDLKFKKNPSMILILCGSVSSWIEKNIISSTGFMGRVSLHFNLKELELPFCTKFWEDAPSLLSPYDKLKMLAVTGGVPRYLEEIIGSLTTENNIKRMCFHREGVLYNEFRLIFSDLFGKKYPLYENIVIRLSQGDCNLNDICEHLDLKKNGVISEYMKELVLAGFVDQDFTWNLRNYKSSTLCKFRLKDNYLRFYLRYVAPNRAKIEKMQFDAVSITSLPGWETIMGYQFENLVLHNSNIIIESLGIKQCDVVQSNPYFQNATKRKSACQVDLLIQTKHGPVYLCEVKFCKREVGTSVIAEVNKKVDALDVPKYASIFPVLVHVNGVSDRVNEADYFSHIIDFSSFLI